MLLCNVSMDWNLDHNILLQGLRYPDFVSSFKRMEENGTKIVAGITANHTLEHHYDFPIFELAQQAIAEFGPIKTSIIFNHPDQVLDAASEAMASGIKQIIIHSGGIPPLDLLQIIKKAKAREGLILGPGNGGIIIPQKLCLGLMETKFYQPGNVGILSTGNWSLNYEIAFLLNKHNLGQSMAINLGDDPILGSSIFSWLNMFENHQETSVIILLINKSQYLNITETKEAIQELISHINKPIIAYFLNGDSSAFSTSKKTSSKMIAEQVPFFLKPISPQKEVIKTLREAKVTIAENVLQIPELVTNFAHKS